MQPSSFGRTSGWMISGPRRQSLVFAGAASVTLFVGLCLGACHPQGGVSPGEGVTPTGGTGGTGVLPDASTKDTGISISVPETSAGETQPAACKDYTVCCGNGRQDPGEECDDGNRAPGDGCSEACKVEADWTCPTWGEACISTVACGDGRVSGDEVCDDRNTVSGDGCSADCKSVEDGWVCNTPGARCQPKCGDGLLKGSEQCDDGNTSADDGCSPTCRVEPGYACPDPGQACHKTVCGDSVKEGEESCDDGNLMPNDGCSPDCKAEPTCVPTQGCTSACGDGLKLPTEECDDGNTRSGDGCSSDCKLETGWKCTAAVEAPGDTLSVPIVYRDMLESTDPLTDPNTPPHPNFEVPRAGGLCTGIVQTTLAADGKPVYNDAVDKTKSCTTNADDFYSWYHDSKYSQVVPDSLVLTAQTGGTFVYDHSANCSRTTHVCTTPPFFPLDNRGWATPPDGVEIPYLGLCTDDNQYHNFSFTSELRYWFEYMGNEKLDFTGDDDVWVFVNGYLAVDIGGVHVATNGSVTLDPAAATKYGLTQHQIYEIVVFQAERRLTQSSYKLTIGQFNRTRTVCAPTCGDGVINGNEICDDGSDLTKTPHNDDNAYGGCTTQCTLGPYCGDGKPDAAFDEECDDGVNLSPTYGSPVGCAPGCRKPHYCGDGIIDSKNQEECDDGPKNGTVGSWCRSDCRLIVP